MRDPARISQILTGLGAVWSDHPDWRFGQLVENVLLPDGDSEWDDGGNFHCIFHIEDSETIKLIVRAIRTD